MISRMALIVLFMAAAVTAHASDVRVSVTEVKDSRSTGQFFNNLEIKLKVTGDDVADVRAIRTVIDRATDETGRNLLLNEEKAPEFKSIQDSGTGPTVDLKFRNPARKATVVKEISGEVQLFLPDRDKAATVTIAKFRSLAGKPLADPDLAKDGVKITVLTKKEYEAQKKQKEREAKAEAAKDMGKAMVQAFAGMFSGFFRVGENDVILQVADPSSNMVGVEVLDKKGTVVQTTSTTYGEEMRVLGFDHALPADARLRVFLKTPKAVVVVPFRLTDIALP